MLDGGSSWSKMLDEMIRGVLEDLQRLASHYIARAPLDLPPGPPGGAADDEARGEALQPAARTGEVYRRLVGSEVPRLRNRQQFFTLATRLIREILLDQARGGAGPGEGFGGAFGVPAETVSSPETLLAVDRALKRLEQIDRRQARLVELCYFGGLTLQQAAEVLEISHAEAERDWSAARRWLARDVQL